MADYTSYGTPSTDWLALAPTIPTLPTDLALPDLIKLTNSGREATSATEMQSQGLVSAVSLRDITVPSRSSGSIEARSYRPKSVSDDIKPLPVYVNLHGGGFLFGTSNSEDAACARIVKSSTEAGLELCVVNVNYRHTPEHSFPVAWEDTEDALVYLHAHREELGLDTDRWVIGGVSAGGQLSASMVLQQYLEGHESPLKSLPRLRGQVLIIPALVHPEHYGKMRARLSSEGVSSYVTQKDAPVLPLERIRLFLGLLKMPDDLKENDRRANVGNATEEEVRGLPPSVFGIAGSDPLRDEGLFYAELLSKVGVPTDVTVFKGVPHGFRRFGEGLKGASEAWDRVIVEGIAWCLSGPKAGEFNIKTD
jgi:acetyl esterase/lipase